MQFLAFIAHPFSSQCRDGGEELTATGKQGSSAVGSNELLVTRKPLGQAPYARLPQ
jgi:hypothetical protein